MAKIQEILASVISGFSTFSLNPESNYFKHISQNASHITSEAWRMTGANLQSALDKATTEVNTEDYL